MVIVVGVGMNSYQASISDWMVCSQHTSTPRDRVGTRGLHSNQTNKDEKRSDEFFYVKVQNSYAEWWAR
jgi:hypothetical protein